MLENLNYLGLGRTVEGNERRREMLKDILSGGTFLPKTVVYEDIDNEFNRWATEEIELKSDEGFVFPTMTLYSNQRFSEYSQSWKYVDDNNNLVLNFKTVTRNNNPEYGKIRDSFWNIPGDRYYLMKRAVVLDENGSESYLDLKMKQPVAIDFLYSLSVFTTKFQYLNEFNQQINKLFSAKQCYICPNGHYMPMLLESISDSSNYSINDRQFYSQTANIRTQGYIITEDDYRIEERPKKATLNVTTGNVRKKKPITEIEEYDKVPIEVIDDCGNKKIVVIPIKNGKKIKIETVDDFDYEEGRYYYRPTVLTINFPKLTTKAEFTIDSDFSILDADFYNLRNHYHIENEEGATIKFRKGDKLTVSVYILDSTQPSTLVLYGYSPSEVFDTHKDNQEIRTNETQFEFQQDVEAVCECDCDEECCDCDDECCD